MQRTRIFFRFLPLLIFVQLEDSELFRRAKYAFKICFVLFCHHKKVSKRILLALAIARNACHYSFLYLVHKETFPIKNKYTNIEYNTCKTHTHTHFINIDEISKFNYRKHLKKNSHNPTKNVLICIIDYGITIYFWPLNPSSRTKLTSSQDFAWESKDQVKIDNIRALI